MSLSQGFTWSYKGHKLIGYSIAGISTSLVFPEADVCFDVAQGLPFQLGVGNILITHAHMDHASGLPYLIAMKAMTGAAPPNIFLPPSFAKPFRRIMQAWEEAEDHAYQFQLTEAIEGVEYPLKQPYFVRPFKTLHRVPSQGYTIYLRRKRLKTAFQDLGREQLIELKKSGQELDDHFEEPILSFTGDTKIEFLDLNPDVRRSRILVMEVTFFDEQKSIENARYWGHIHLDELIPKLDSIQSERIVLIHASARYSTKAIKAILEDKIPEQHKTRVELFPRPM